jgi:hypothetical protein
MSILLKSNSHNINWLSFGTLVAINTGVRVRDLGAGIICQDAGIEVRMRKDRKERFGS